MPKSFRSEEEIILFLTPNPFKFGLTMRRTNLNPSHLYLVLSMLSRAFYIHHLDLSIILCRIYNINSYDQFLKKGTIKNRVMLCLMVVLLPKWQRGLNARV